MSILVRPVREQLEHDRLIRFLQAKYKTKRKFTVAVNVGDEQVAPMKVGALTLYPDLLLTEGRKLALVAEVESGESTNNLEALAQWVHFARSRVPFHLYVPVPFFEAAKRLCQSNQARVTEIWTYRPTHDGFDLVKAFNEDPALVRQAAHRKPAPSAPAAGPDKVVKAPASAANPARKTPRPASASSAKGPKGKKAAPAVRKSPKPSPTARAGSKRAASTKAKPKAAAKRKR